LNTKKQALTVIEIDALAPSTLTGADERRETVSLDDGDYLSKPETRQSAASRWFIDTLALAGCGMAGVYVGDWLDPSNVSGDQTGGKDETLSQQRGVATAAMMQTDGRLIESFRLGATKTAGIFTTPFSFFLEDGPRERGRTALALLDQESEDHDEPCRKNFASSRRTAARPIVHARR
jgi:hypothetical protein